MVTTIILGDYTQLYLYRANFRTYQGLASGIPFNQLVPLDFLGVKQGTILASHTRTPHLPGCVTSITQMLNYLVYRFYSVIKEGSKNQVIDRTISTDILSSLYSEKDDCLCLDGLCSQNLTNLSFEIVNFPKWLYSF